MHRGLKLLLGLQQAVLKINLSLLDARFHGTPEKERTIQTDRNRTGSTAVTFFPTPLHVTVTEVTSNPQTRVIARTGDAKTLLRHLTVNPDTNQFRSLAPCFFKDLSEPRIVILGQRQIGHPQSRALCNRAALFLGGNEPDGQGEQNKGENPREEFGNRHRR